MSVSPVMTTLIKKRDIYNRKITSVMSCIKTGRDLVKNSFLEQKDLDKERLSIVTHLNEQIIDAFIEYCWNYFVLMGTSSWKGLL